jgi:(3,5-dihydroxyphenyl)acetyl-CoA 1,2-dioxygenase
MAAGPESRLDEWGGRRPSPSGSLGRDAAELAEWHAAAGGWVAELAVPSPAAFAARTAWRAQVRRATAELVRRHVDELDEILSTTDAAGVIEGLASTAPGLVAASDERADDARRPLADKIGFEYKDAVVLSELLGASRPGRRLLEGSRRPLSRSLELLPRFRRDDVVELAGARVRRRGPAAVVELASTESLNAESDPVLDALEICVDLALLDPDVTVGVLRGAVVSHRKYAGRRVFCSGLNLTELYEGRLTYLYYVRRELGLVSKLFRGLTFADGRPEVEKPWIAVVETHAIGGGCQLLLVMDLVIAEQGSSLVLPARREGIIPGAANLRLPRLVGERTARRMILMDRAIEAGSPDAAGLVDEVLPPDQVDGSIDAAVAGLTSSGLVSLAGNRKALRVGQEPADVFQAYMAHFALAQADCHFSPALVANLERHWVRREGATRETVP